MSMNKHQEQAPFEKDWTGKKVCVVFSQGLDSTILSFYYKSRGADVTLLYFTTGPWNDPTDSFYDPTQPAIMNDFTAEEPDFYANWHKRNADMNVVKVRYPQLNALHAIVPPDNPAAEHAEGLGLHFWVGYKSLMSMIAMSYGAAHGMDLVVFGHLNEDTAYYDEHPETFQPLRDYMVKVYPRVKIPEIDNPYCGWNYNKQDVIRLGYGIGAPLDYTYSCRRTPAVRAPFHTDGRYVHCGVCENCLRRKAAFKIYGKEDPALYDNPR